jgi:hypothetical protein
MVAGLSPVEPGDVVGRRHKTPVGRRPNFLRATTLLTGQRLFRQANADNRPSQLFYCSHGDFQMYASADNENGVYIMISGGSMKAQDAVHPKP